VKISIMNEKQNPAGYPMCGRPVLSAFGGGLLIQVRRERVAALGASAAHTAHTVRWTTLDVDVPTRLRSAGSGWRT